MAAKYVGGGVLWVMVAIVAAACSGDPYVENCGAGGACGSQQGGIGVERPTCEGGECSCSKEGDVPCCPYGEKDCEEALRRCVPAPFCVTDPTKCATDADCPGPVDARCGTAWCEDGECKRSLVHIIPNQYPGDCKSNECNYDGEIEVITDPGDIPHDGNPCTFDMCDGDTPIIFPLLDTTACVGNGWAPEEVEPGVCISGFCRDCWELYTGLDVCPSGLTCTYWWCRPYQCKNGVKDANEPYEDAGGPCAPSGPGGNCFVAGDCQQGVCTNGKCLAPTHVDSIKNGDETGVDCGYPGGPPNACKDGEGCSLGTDCQSSVCYKGVCQTPTCTDGTKNGTEAEMDCGGGCPPCQK